MAKKAMYLILWTEDNKGIIIEHVKGRAFEDDIVCGSVEKEPYVKFTCGSCSPEHIDKVKKAFPEVCFD